MRSGKDGEYYFIEIESHDELEKLRELTLKKIRTRNAVKKMCYNFFKRIRTAICLHPHVYSLLN